MMIIGKREKCEGCGIRVGVGFIEQTLTPITALRAISTMTGLKLTKTMVTLQVCSSCLAATQRRKRTYGVAYITPPS